MMGKAGRGGYGGLRRRPGLRVAPMRVRQGKFETIIRLMGSVSSLDDLDHAMRVISKDLGFQFFALTHHVDILVTAHAIHLHNYPDRWADYYDRNALGLSDPVHRASQRTGVGFCWARLPFLIPLTDKDRRHLLQGRDAGIGDGFTVPVNIPGEAYGSCSFANETGRPIREETLGLAQLAGTFAFEAARYLWNAELAPNPLRAPILTDRQRDCALWAARGKTDWEISQILHVSQETVAMHIKQARERYGVQKRALVAIRALFDGTLSFDDILRR